MSIPEYDGWKDKLAQVLDMKVEEFELLGYGGADREEIWQCAVKKVGKESPNEPVHLHHFVSELLGLSVNDYMNRLRIASLKGPDWFADGEPINLNGFDEPSP